MTSLELSNEHNYLVQKKMDLLCNNGIAGSRDDSYKKLHPDLQVEYLSIQSALTRVQKEMMRSWVRS